MGKAYPDHHCARLHPSPNHGERAEGTSINTLILHYTALEDGEKAVQWLCNPESEVSAHYMVHKDGSIEQMVPESRRAWHAGKSCWQGVTDINSCSIGVEICNPGLVCDPPPAYPDVQIDAVIELCQGIVSRHAIQPRHILAHSDIAPARKQDPGEHFPWSRLAENGIGHFVEPEPIASGMYFSPGESGQPIEALQSMLALYGYEVDVSGHFDEATRLAVIAFQRHFRPLKVDGIADMSTISTLHRVLKSLPALAS